MRHRSILREIRYLQSVRTRKGKNRKRKIEKKITLLRQKADNIANDSMNRIVHAVIKGVDKVVIENLSDHGGNRNRSMRENRVGGFLHKLGQKCEARGIELEAVPAKNTNQTCHSCGHHSKKSRLTRDTCNRSLYSGVSCRYQRGV